MQRTQNQCIDKPVPLQHQGNASTTPMQNQSPWWAKADAGATSSSIRVPGGRKHPVDQNSRLGDRETVVTSDTSGDAHLSNRNPNQIVPTHHNTEKRVDTCGRSRRPQGFPLPGARTSEGPGKVGAQGSDLDYESFVHTDSENSFVVAASLPQRTALHAGFVKLTPVEIWPNSATTCADPAHPGPNSSSVGPECPQFDRIRADVGRIAPIQPNRSQSSAATSATVAPNSSNLGARVCHILPTHWPGDHKI